MCYIAVLEKRSALCPCSGGYLTVKIVNYRGHGKKSCVRLGVLKKADGEG
jgi:hypothetical protein